MPKKLSTDPKRMAQAITNALNSTALAIKADFETTAQTWNDKPTFQIATLTTYTRAIGTEHAVYAMLNKGTKPHLIRPKGGGVLVFRTPFQAKTVPRQIMSGPGRKGANQVFTRRPINHPGTKARAWDQAIAEKWRKQFPAIMQRAIDSAVN